MVPRDRKPGDRINLVIGRTLRRENPEVGNQMQKHRIQGL